MEDKCHVVRTLPWCLWCSQIRQRKNWCIIDSPFLSKAGPLYRYIFNSSGFQDIPLSHISTMNCFVEVTLARTWTKSTDILFPYLVSPNYNIWANVWYIGSFYFRIMWLCDDCGKLFGLRRPIRKHTRTTQLHLRELTNVSFGFFQRKKGKFISSWMICYIVNWIRCNHLDVLFCQCNINHTAESEWEHA